MGVAQTATYSNFFETTLNGILPGGNPGQSTMTLTAAPTTNGTTGIAAPYYLVIDPDETSSREVVLVTAASGVNVTAMTRDVENRHGTNKPTHTDGTTVRMAVVGQMFEDLHLRLNDVALTGDVTGTISSTTQDVATSIASGDIVNADVNSSAAIDASKIHNGNVSNTEFGYLDGVSSAIQTQIDNISAGAVTLTVPITVKVADDGSGSQNVFYFLSGTDTGAGTRSSNFIFKIGFKYKFDTSDSSMSGHTFKFSLTADNSGSSEFTTNVTTAGTPGSAGASTTIEITPETLGIAGATSTLYYYCSNHSGMGGAGSINLYSSGSGGGGDIHGFLLMGA